MSRGDRGAFGSRAPLAGRRVLVIEDEYFIADDLARALGALGAEIVGPVAEVEDAEDILSAGTVIHGALLDINLHSVMSFPLARLLLARKIPLVFTTGYGRDMLGPEFQHVRLCEKPLDVARVAHTLIESMKG